ncbi:MAG: phenylalanine--tRNA ligase subunit alpha [Candidatus Bipolaricaulota bacterium]
MALEQLRGEVDEVRRQWAESLPSAQDPEALEELRVRFLGRKGKVTALMSRMKELDSEQRAEAGKVLNSLKQEVSQGLEERRRALEKLEVENRLAAERYDLSLPGMWRPVGHLHPLTQVRLEIEDIFLKLGFDVAAGPEVETDYYNFEALNIPADHPARDEWDSFYVDEGLLLRTHTSPVQIRVMKERQPPVRIICPGKCYRRDNPDATHAQVFHQVELLWVEEGLSMAHLKWIIGEFVSVFFGPEYEMRFAADFFPFTEPSAQVHIRPRGQAATGRHHGGWLEIMGAGMVDPLVLDEVGYDPERYTGFAFGLGVERMAMLRWGIEDIRLFLQNDPRFLRQF